MSKIVCLAGLTLLFVLPVTAQGTTIDTTATLKNQTLSDVTVTTRKASVKSLSGAISGKDVLRDELLKAACYNLSESFVNNASIDVNYSDMATGAERIKLLGLSSTYVQVLTENLPNFRDAALPYSLGYVPGSWIKSMQMSEGNTSVRNGCETVTGQINVEYVKPGDPTGMTVNLYGNTAGRFEANADGNIHISDNKNLSTEILAHYESDWLHHDGSGDGFQDAPKVRQYNLRNRWFWKKGDYILHAGLSLLKEDRVSGQTPHAATANPCCIDIGTDRYGAYMKHAFILNKEHATSIVLMGNVSMHKQEAQYGIKQYDVNEKGAYTLLIFETNFTDEHNLSAGLSLNHNYLRQTLTLPATTVPSDYGNIFLLTRGTEGETMPGAYVQYTYNLRSRFIAMIGLRVGHDNAYGTFFTPRFHLKWVPANFLTPRLSAGRSYCSPHALAENNYLMASGRRLVIDKLDQETARNYGASLNFLIPIGSKILKINTDYYYMHFLSQMLIDYDSNPQELHITSLSGKNFSHTFQVEASYPLFRSLELGAACRYNLIKSTYGGRLIWKPLQSRYKELLTPSYKTPLGVWRFDATTTLNGDGRMPESYTLASGERSWTSSYKTYGRLSGRVIRYFRHFLLYISGENLTNYKQKNPIIGYQGPWASGFEPIMVYGPVKGTMAYVSIRLNLDKRQ